MENFQFVFPQIVEVFYSALRKFIHNFHQDQYFNVIMMQPKLHTRAQKENCTEIKHAN